MSRTRRALVLLSLSLYFFTNTLQSPFAQRVPIRAYEHLITLLHKYPWHAHEHVLLSERAAFHDMTVRYIKMLMERLREDEVRTGPPPKGLQVPTTATLKELAVAALTCPGFSEAQKAAIVLQLSDGNFKYLIEGRGFNLRFGGDNRFATEWPFHALVMQPGVGNDVVEVSVHFDNTNPSSPSLTTFTVCS